MLAIYVLLSQNNRAMKKTLLHRMQTGNQELIIVPNNVANFKESYNYIVYTFIIANIESDVCFIHGDKRC
jgi:hypothetical protein